ncbi:PREDICTED: glypican-6 isoform X2 [Dinoponera quadriceps]|uniref:Glypican-6 isoform X2 n=1 Tax=Dinoponera quadriceps TaxID=609295 RepID=A0A6P3X1W2_DINQU|nr:PREDICTED: glypican-6 isoform X2 [Dinoponera quadriceps]
MRDSRSAISRRKRFHELKVCGSASSGGEVCCSADMELRLQARARDSHEKTARETLHKLHQILTARGNKFHVLFKDLLAGSKRGFHDMFKKTYGILYEQNAYVFTDFFQELESYYAKGTVDLDDCLDNFFNILYQKMFIVLNSQYTFDNKYLECVSDHMKEMKPFGDVPPKLSVQIKRSFVATRAFSQALTVAANVLKNMQTLKPSADCAAALTKMTACPYCIGIPNNVLACSDMCTNVMKGCLAQHAALDAEWNHFVDAVDKIADRLIGPFNVEVLVRPINLKISEAIMNFQENSQDVSQRVFTGCGRPILGKRRRRDDHELQLETLNFDQDPVVTDDRAQDNAVHMDKVVKEIRQRVRDSKQFWVYLPYRLCNDGGLVVQPTNTKECWNGTHVDKYRYPVASDGESQKNNAEVRSVGPRSTIVRDQLYALTTITNRLKLAFNGQDVEWMDSEETYFGSGSGSGDGSFTDDEDGFKESSGYGPPEPEPPKQQPPPVVHEVETPPRMKIEPKNVGANNVNNQTNAENGASRQKMSLSRALTTYLLPIVMMWFGGCLTEWL